MENKTDKKMGNGMVVKLVVVAVVAAGLGFFGGTSYAKKSFASGASRGNVTFGAANFGGGAGGPGGGQGRGGFRAGGANAAGGFVNGEVLSIDANGITVKLRDGGSKIVFAGESTVVSKPTDIKLSEVAVGDNVVVMGKANDDGSVTAQNIQVRPAGMPAPGMGGMMIRGGEQGAPQGAGDSTAPQNK